MVARRVVRYRAEDIWDTPDDGNRYEVLDGDLLVTPPPTWEHQNASGTLFGYLWQYIHPRRLGKLVAAPVGVVLDELTGLEPDLVYISPERQHIISRRGVEGSPDLVVEVLSPSTRRRDLGRKLERYARAGIPHYWTLDPVTRELRAMELAGETYEVTGIYGPGQVFRPALFPGLEIPIDDLWV